MEILQKPQEQPIEPTGEKQEIAPEVFNGITVPVMENMQYLGLTDRMFDSEVMDKVTAITDYLNGEDIMNFDAQLGNPYGLSKLDNMYSYVQLAMQENDIRTKEQLLRQQKQRYAVS